MCQYCDMEEGSGELIPFETKVDGTKQHYEMSIIEDIENEQMSLQIYGSFSDIRIKIHFCPMCGRKLIY